MQAPTDAHLLQTLKYRAESNALEFFEPANPVQEDLLACTLRGRIAIDGPRIQIFRTARTPAES